VGGNIGVIEDPFGTPKLIAATSGQFLGMPDGLTLSADGKTLYAAFSGDNAVRVFDVQLLIATLNASANQGGTIIRRDGIFKKLELTPLAGPDVPGSHNYHPISPTIPGIQLSAIGTGRFPQGLAIIDSLSVELGFGRAADAGGGVVINAQAEAGDTTPVFRWKVERNETAQQQAATSRLYLSVFREGQGLFDTDRLDQAGNDLFAHRILTRVQADHRETANADVFEVDLSTIEPIRQLTLGQTYYVGVEILDDNGNVIHRASREFKLEQAAPTDLTKFSNVTILTHGFEPPWEKEIP